MIRRGGGGISNNVAGDFTVSGGGINVTSTTDTSYFYSNETRFYGDLVLSGALSKILSSYGPNPIGILPGVTATKICSFRTYLNVEQAYVTTAGAYVGANIAVGATLAGTNSGDVTLAAVGSAPDANGASLSGQVLTLQPASATHPGVVANVAQTFAGKKTFASGIVTSSSSLSPTNGGSVTPNASAGNVFLVTANAGVASYTINAPTNPDVSQIITFSIVNVSGGASTVTWDAVFKKVWTDPADGFYGGIQFVYNGSVWIQIGAAVSNIPI